MSKTGERVVEEINKERPLIIVWEVEEGLYEINIDTLRITKKEGHLLMKQLAENAENELNLINIKIDEISKNISLFCPYCKKKITPEKEDNRCDTDRGTMGEINYFCPECEKDITDESENELDKIIRKKLNLNLSTSEPECKTNEGDVCGGQTPQGLKKGDINGNNK